MTVHISWDNNTQTTIRMEFVGEWTWDEVHRALAKNVEMLDSVDHSVNAIVDLSKSMGAPTLVLTQLRSIVQNRHPRSNMTVLVGANDMLMTFWKIFLQAYGRITRSNRYSYAKTVAEARDLIAAKTEQMQVSA